MRYLTLSILVAAASLAGGCVTPRQPSLFPGAKSLPGGYSALEPVGGSRNFHVIMPGETLFRIAIQNGVSLEALKAANGISDENLVKAGSRLLIPAPGSSTAAKAPVPPRKQDKASQGKPLAFEKSLVRPAEGRTVVRFGDSVQGTVSGHVEIMSACGSPVVAARTGKVILASERFPGYGRVVMLQHEKGVTTLYGRLGSMEVAAGSVVKQGEKIGTAGAKALVFELSIGGKTRDPASYY